VDANPYATLFGLDLDSEAIVRRTLRQLESDLREMALLALADWEKLQLVSTELFAAVAALQRPSWGMWNGLISALRNARKTVLRTGGPRERLKIDGAATLNLVLAALDESLGAGASRLLEPLAELTHVSVVGKVKLGQALTMPIALRNRIAHDAPDDANWWRVAAEAVAPLVRLFATERARPSPTPNSAWPAPWFLTEGGDVWSFNGLSNDPAVIYVSRGGATRTDPSAPARVFLSFQRLLGKAEVQEQDFRKLLAKLAPEDLKGVLMGDYLLGHPVGSGGFATVHVGRQLSTGRKVALKILHDGTPEEDKLRFRQEAAYLSRFNHPHIVGVLDYGEEVWSAPRQFSLANEPWFSAFAKSAPVKTYISLEWVDGETLDSVFGRLPADRPTREMVIQWFIQAANALQTVHAAGLVHRDVKPGNLMVTADGHLKLMDFGIARSQGDLKTILTATGRTLGTPPYMSPEQLRGTASDAAVGPASDIYSLCATFYELFTGTRLYRHDTETAERVNTRKLTGELPERPSKHIPGLPWEIETILLGGLQTEISDRYRSMEALEGDLRRFVKNEPIEYRRPSLVRRVRLWHRRNRLVANLLLALFIGVVFYLGTVVLQQRRILVEHSRWAQAQVDQLLTADARQAKQILLDLNRVREEVLPKLHAYREDPELDEHQRDRVLMALLPEEPEHVDKLMQAMLVAEPEELLLLRDVLEPRAADLLQPLWQVVDDAGSDPARRFRAAVTLAKYDGNSQRWTGIADMVVHEYLSANRLHLGLWTEALRPVRGGLLGPLAKAFRDPGEDLAKQEQHQTSAIVLADYAADRPDLLADLLTDGDEKQFAVIYPKLKDQGDQALSVLTDEVAKKPPAELPSSDEERDKLAKRQANAAVALLRMGRPGKVWPLLKRTPPDDPRVRSYLIHRLSPLKADAGAIVKRLEEESDITIRRALLLSLGEFSETDLPPTTRTSLVSKLQGIFCTASDPGLHAAAEWLLRMWKQADWLKRVNDEWARDAGGRAKRIECIQHVIEKGEAQAPPQWYVNGQGQTMVVVHGPLEFVMGSPPTEDGRFGGPQDRREKQAKRRILRCFAIASTPVTVAQFQSFRREHVYNKGYSNKSDCPMNQVTWYDAAAYCNWLSVQEGLEPVYEPNEHKDSGPGMKLKANYLHLNGYRLPTESEWEYSCRAGAVTSRYYGETAELLCKYACYTANSHDRWMLPVASLKPNDLGLFDMLGNAYQWREDREGYYAAGDDKEDIDDTKYVLNDVRRVMRGRSFLYRASNVRCADRYFDTPAYLYFTVGFRPARTLPPSRLQ
jgi:serine/threonine protein kinase/formylglycine-generating enzyme required for sulfatase activity